MLKARFPRSVRTQPDTDIRDSSAAPTGTADLLALSRTEATLDDIALEIARLSADGDGFEVAEVLRVDASGVWERVAIAPEGREDEAEITVAPGDAAQRAVDQEAPSWAGETLAVPLIVDGSAWGVLRVSRGRGERSDAAVERVASLAQIGALLLGYKDAQTRLERVAANDPLTGLPNEHNFVEQLKRELKRATRTGSGLAVAVCEIDQLARVLDEQGPAAADAMIAEIGDSLDTLVRSHEMIARLDDDTFGWILVGVDPETAGGAAQRAMRAISNSASTMSIGVADIAYASEPHGLLERAREALGWVRVVGGGSIAHYSPDGPVTGGRTPNTIEQRVGSGASRAPRVALLRTLHTVDPAMGRHSERVGDLSARIAMAMGWSDTLISAIRDAALLHDIGMLCIPDEILNKPGKLTESEYARVRQHAVLGAEMAAKILMPAQAAWIRGHHERWDGTGYPDALRGEQIPEGAAIIALADAWDTMTAARTYAAMLSAEEALEEVRRATGTQFAPTAADAIERVILEGESPGDAAAAAAESFAAFMSEGEKMTIRTTDHRP